MEIQLMFCTFLDLEVRTGADLQDSHTNLRCSDKAKRRKGRRLHRFYLRVRNPSPPINRRVHGLLCSLMHNAPDAE